MTASINMNKCLCHVRCLLFKRFLFSPIKRILCKPKANITFTWFPKVLSPLKDFPFFLKKKKEKKVKEEEKRSPRAPTTSAVNCFEHRVKSWHFILGFGATRILLWWQPAWRRKGVKCLSRRTRQTHLPPKLNNANYAETYPCQRGSLPLSQSEAAFAKQA